MVAWNSVNEEDIAEENSDEMEENNTENNTENEHIDDYDVEQLLKNEDTSSFAVISYQLSDFIYSMLKRVVGLP